MPLGPYASLTLFTSFPQVTMSESQPAKELTGLEKEMAALLAQTADINSGAKQFKSEATKVRRKSRDLELQISSMTAPDKFGAAAGRRSRRQSRDYSEDALKIAFDVIDTNKTGSIPEEKLLEVIRAIDPNVTDEFADGMIKSVEAKDGKVEYAEFFKMMLYRQTPKPAE
uniref:EF-hand domain-containing protein n=1 Tax=Chrysotila carterae TaxID=13221 RepID=A0A7S4EVC4_CHRCT